MIAYFDPQPGPQPAEVPARLPSPFAIPPHPLALRAVAEVSVGALTEGKMFGVLVVRARGFAASHWGEGRLVRGRTYGGRRSHSRV